MTYADDLSGAGKIADIRSWWGMVEENDLKLGYCPNVNKSVLTVKPDFFFFFPKRRRKHLETVK